MVAKSTAGKKTQVTKGVKKDIKKTDRPKSGVVDADFEIDETERYSGECVMYDKGRGFGFVTMDTEDIVPDNKLMVHWRELQSSDRWPYLMKGTKVEFSLKKVRDGRESFSIKAKEVSLAGGEQIALQAARDEKTEFIGDQNMRFLGNVKWYDFKKGFGYVTIQDGYDVAEDVPKEFRIDRQEINSGEDAPRLANEMEIEFGIQKSPKGNYSCYNVTLPGGEEVARNVVEGRKDASKTSFKGKIHFYAIKDGFGFVIPENMSKLPKNYQDLIKADTEKRSKRAGKQGKDAPEEAALYFRAADKADRSQRLNRGDAVTFKVYEDSRGVGACEVSQV